MLLPRQFSTQQVRMTNPLVSAHKSLCKQVSHDVIYVSVLKNTSWATINRSTGNIYDIDN